MEKWSEKGIAKELDAIDRGEPRSWGAVGALLNAIESSGYWARDARSFTGWLECNAPRFGVRSATVWRRLTAARFIEQVKASLKQKGIEVPPLEEVSAKVGPESVELLAKIERAVPPDEFPGLAIRVFAGEMTRSELRSVWEAYRPVLGGKTARGRGVPPPRLNPTDPEQYRSLLEARTLETFKAAGPVWLGNGCIDQYQVFFHVTPEGYRVFQGGFLFPVVAVVGARDRDIEYHGFSYPLPLRKGEVRRQPPPENYCDRIWIMVPPRSMFRPRTSDLLETTPEFMGVVRVEDGEIEVLRDAGQGPETGSQRDRLISALLARSSGRR